MKSVKTKGSLILVSVPIGNMGDLSKRAYEMLKYVDCIACEDTRVAGKLLAKLPIANRPDLISYRDENESYLAEKLAERIDAGEEIALVSDAGTPAISDPGFRLVRECHRRRLAVTSTPGPCAAIAALSISGLPSDGFFFTGFLPPKRAARQRFLKSYQDFGYTIVAYESCHRVIKFINDLVDSLGPNRCICVARELTKKHETVFSGPAYEVRQHIEQGSIKGEFVICIAKDGFVL